MSLGSAQSNATDLFRAGMDAQLVDGVPNPEDVFEIDAKDVVKVREIGRGTALGLQNTSPSSCLSTFPLNPRFHPNGVNMLMGHILRWIRRQHARKMASYFDSKN